MSEPHKGLQEAMTEHMTTPEVDAELEALSIEAVQEFMSYSFTVLMDGFEEAAREFTEQAVRTGDEGTAELARVHITAAALIRDRVTKIRAQDPQVIEAGVQAALAEIEQQEQRERDIEALFDLSGNTPQNIQDISNPPNITPSNTQK